MPVQKAACAAPQPRPRRISMPDYWLELSVTAEPEAVEAISEVMSRYANGGVAIEEPYTLLDDGQVAQTVPDAPVTVHVYVPADASGEEARARIEEGLWHLRQIGFGNISEISTKRLAEKDWENAWKSFTTSRISANAPSSSR